MFVQRRRGRRRNSACMQPTGAAEEPHAAHRTREYGAANRQPTRRSGYAESRARHRSPTPRQTRSASYATAARLIHEPPGTPVERKKAQMNREKSSRYTMVTGEAPSKWQEWKACRATPRRRQIRAFVMHRRAQGENKIDEGGRWEGISRSAQEVRASREEEEKVAGVTLVNVWRCARACRKMHSGISMPEH